MFDQDGAETMTARVLVVTSRFNELITNELRRAADEELTQRGVQVTQVSVPGAFELPVAASVAASSGNYDAIICLGCVIRGETPHFDYVAGSAASGLTTVAVNSKIPVIFGVLTTDTEQQALARCGLKGGNKGREAAQSAIEMIDTLKKIRDGRE